MIFLMGRLMHDRGGNLCPIEGLEYRFHEGHHNLTVAAESLAKDPGVRLLNRYDINIFNGADVLLYVAEPTGTSENIGMFFA